MQPIISLENHVGKLGVTHALLGLYPWCHAFACKHRSHSEKPSYVAYKVNWTYILVPRFVVDNPATLVMYQTGARVYLILMFIETYLTGNNGYFSLFLSQINFSWLSKTFLILSCILKTFLTTSLLSIALRSCDFPLGSPILPVAPPICNNKSIQNNPDEVLSKLVKIKCWFQRLPRQWLDDLLFASARDLSIQVSCRHEGYLLWDQSQHIHIAVSSISHQFHFCWRK